MALKVKKWVKRVGYLLFLLLFFFFSLHLFFEDVSNKFWGGFLKEDSQDVTVDNFRIVYPESVSNLCPYNLEFKNRLFAINVYEPLLRFDADLNFEPVLAKSYGLIEDDIWEFYLREDVYFHDGTKFDFLDVEKSFERAKFSKNSQIQNYLSSVDEIIKIDDYRFRIKTKYPDPLLLSKLTLFMISSDTVLDDELLDEVVGTGPFEFISMDEDRIIYTAFSEYWGKKTYFENVIAIFEDEKSKRLDLFLEGDSDFLAFVPQDAALIVGQYDFAQDSVPSLEVHSLFFNFDSEFFKNLEVRKFFYEAFDKDELLALLGDFVFESDQFVSNGVFGFNSSLVYDRGENDFRDRAEELDLISKEITVALPSGATILGQNLKKQFKEFGVKILPYYFDPEDFVLAFESRDYDIYYLGFKSELGDSFDFFDSIAWSKGSFNYFSYENLELDDLFEVSKVTMQDSERLIILKRMMEIVLDNDYLGLPLFEYETIFAFKNDFEFLPRIDALIYFNDIGIKK